MARAGGTVNSPQRELIGSARVAFRLPSLHPGPHGPCVCSCNYGIAPCDDPTFSFGPQHAIGMRVRKSSKPVLRV